MNRKIILFALFLIAVGAVTFVYSSMREGQPAIGSREVAAVVNGKPIYMDDVAREMATVPAGQRQNLSELQVLDFLIEKRLLLEAATKEGVVVTQQEIEELYRKYANPAYFDLKATEALMREQNLTKDELIERLAEQATINKLLEEKVNSRLAAQKISSSEVEQIYESDFKDKNIPFDDAEDLIITLILQKREENIRTSYVNSLKTAADIAVLIRP